MSVNRRSRAGCSTCRLRKVKCDECQPHCGPCLRSGRQCSWYTQWRFISLDKDVQSRYKLRNAARLREFLTQQQSRTYTVNWTPTPEEEEESRTGKRVHTSPPALQQVLANQTIDEDKLVSFFDDYVCPQLIPLAMSRGFHIYEGQNVLVFASRRFAPLHHAICAVTLLSCGINKRPELVAESLRHYHQAITSSAAAVSRCPDAVFFLHYLLLMYDLGCAGVTRAQDRPPWLLQLSILARLATETTGKTPLRAFLAWYLVFVDCQAALAGSQESGTYMRVFLANPASFPLWPLHGLGNGQEEIVVVKLAQLSQLVVKMFAKLGVLARDIGVELATGQSNANRRRQQIMTMSHEQDTTWSQSFQRLFGTAFDFGQIHPHDTPSTFTFVALQFAIVKIYLFNSLYPGQRLECTEYAAENERHCTTIIEAAVTHWHDIDGLTHYFPPQLFIAGYVSTSRRHKNIVLDLLKSMEGSGYLGSVAAVHKLLHRIISEQYRAFDEGRDPREVDWLHHVREDELQHIVLALGEPLRGSRNDH